MRNSIALGAAALLLGWGLREQAAMLMADRESWRLVHTLGISLTGIGAFAFVAGIVRWIAHARGEQDFLDAELAAPHSSADPAEPRRPGPSLRVRRHRRRRERAVYLADLAKRDDDSA